MGLLQKSSVRAKKTNEVLLQVLEEPVTRHLPVNSHIVGGLYYCLILFKANLFVLFWPGCDFDVSMFLGDAGLSYSSEKLVHIDDYVSVMSDSVSPVFVVSFTFINKLMWQKLYVEV